MEAGDATGPDPLRQRVALALSELFVVSDKLADTIADNPIGLANYYDMLLEDAFGNYRDLLLDVTLHPIMGTYLSHLRNEKSDPRRGRFPDENYAREIMQLFSIGLYQLSPTARCVLDGAGQPIPTYDNDDITEFAKIFTGLSFDGPDHDFHDGEPVWTAPMRMYEEYHEPGPKHLLRGTLRAARPDRHAGRRGRDRQPVPAPQRRPVRRAPADPAPGHLEPEPGLRPRAWPRRSPTTDTACAAT